MCSLDQDEIDAIAQHEGIPEIIALEFAEYTINCPDGERCIRRIIVDDIAAAEAVGDTERARKLRMVMRHFIRTHPLHRATA